MPFTKEQLLAADSDEKLQAELFLQMLNLFERGVLALERIAAQGEPKPVLKAN